MGRLSSFLHEHVGEIFICVGLISYLIGISCLTALNSPIFVVCSYIGTITFASGILYKLGLFPSSWKSKGILPLTFFFVSALAFTTAMITLFIGITFKYNVLGGWRAGGPVQPPTTVFEYGYNPVPSIDVSAYGNLNLQIERVLTPWIKPLIIVGGASLLFGFLLLWICKGF
ncbi:MAG: hypothetical protein QXN95_02165 [Candidatus Bathyarchaeia archaeon]